MAQLFYEQKLNRNMVTRFLHGGRYRHLEQFAAKNLAGRDVVRVLDIGCGPGGAYKSLRDMLNIDYTGVDIREDFIETAQARYREDVAAGACRFEVQDVTIESFDFTGFDMVIALETFEHVPEGALVRVIERIAAAKPSYVLCSVPIEIGPSVAIKNFGGRIIGHNRGRGSGSARETLLAATYNLNALPPHGTAHLGFNWFWLEQTLRQNLKVLESRSLPWKPLPKWLAPSVMFTCQPYD